MKRLKAFLSVFDGTDIPVVVLILGVILLGYGAEQVHDGLGWLVVGALLVLYVKPLLRWMR